MLRATRRDPLGHLAELNVTPLLDLSFVLLVIFMITAPLLGNQNIELELPTSQAGENSIPLSNYHVLSIDANAQLYLDDEPIANQEIQQRLQGIQLNAANEEKQIAVIIEAHKALTIEQVVPIFEILTQAGITNTALVTKSRN